MDSGPRWQRLEPDQRRDEILRCAQRLFAQQPYGRVSTTEVAKEAGVTRGLVNHYFGTKRDLYLAVIREAAKVPQTPLTFAPGSTLAERVELAVTWFETSLSGANSEWINAGGAQALGRDPELDHILRTAEEAAVDRVLESVGLTDVGSDDVQVRATIRAYGQLARAAGREWQRKKTLSREQFHHLLTSTLLTIVEDVLPRHASAHVPRD